MKLEVNGLLTLGSRENDLMDDAAAGFLESDSVLNAGGGQEVSDLYSKVFHITESSREQ